MKTISCGIAFTILFATCAPADAQIPSAAALQTLLVGNNYIELAQKLPEASGLTPEEKLYFQGILAYRQGRFEEAIAPLVAAVNTPGASLSSLQVENVLETLGDADARMYQYRKSVELYDEVDKLFGERMGTYIRVIREKRAISAVLQNVPPQTVQIAGDFSLKKTGDWLAEYPLSIGGKKFSAVLDTGAAFSILSESAAKKWGAAPMDGTVLLHGYSGDSFRAHPALVSVLQLGKAELRNVVVFVTEDKNLYFDVIQKQLHAVLGYPVTSALGRLTFAKNGTLTIGAHSPGTSQNNETALWVGDSSLLISLNTFAAQDEQIAGKEPRLFLLDTGSLNTYLTDHYLAEHRDAFTGSPTGVSRLAGYGGIKAIPAYTADHLRLWFGSLAVTLTGEDVLADPQDGEAEGYFGLIGQNLLRQFSSYTIDFRTMRFGISP